MASILVIGSANVDYTLVVPRLPGAGETINADKFERYLGGKGLNQAVAAARAGGSVDLVARIGNDDLGEALLAALVAEGIGVEDVAVSSTPSGVAVVLTAVGGDNMIIVVPGANATLHPSALDAKQFAGKRIVLCQLEIPTTTVLRAAELARAAGATFVLDPAPATLLPRELLAQVGWLTPNETEARFLLNQPHGAIDPLASAFQIQAMGVDNVVMKLGARGSLLLAKNAEPVFIPAIRVQAIDTTAAGDSFNGAFAVALIEGASPLAAARFASAAAAVAVTRIGACDAMPFRGEIDRSKDAAAHTHPAVRKDA